MLRTRTRPYRAREDMIRGRRYESPHTPDPLDSHQHSSFFKAIAIAEKARFILELIELSFQDALFLG